MTDGQTEAAGTPSKGSPSHIPYTVRRASDNREFWDPCGVAFINGDRKGVNIALGAIPLGGRIVVRERVRPAKVEGEDASSVQAQPTGERSTSPTHLAWSVREGKEGRAYWTRVGIAYEHNNGVGWTVLLSLVPLDGRIVVRPRDQKVDGEVDSGQPEVTEHA